MKKIKNKLVKKLKKLVKRVCLQYNIVKSTIQVNLEIFKNSTFLASVHPYAGFKIKGGEEIREIRLGFLTLSQYVYQSSPRLHGFKLDSSYVTTSWNMHRIPNTLTVGFFVSPFWLVVKMFNYRAVKNMQNPNLGFNLMTSVVNSSKGETLDKILTRRDKNVKPRKLTKFEKQILSGKGAKFINKGKNK